MSKGTTIILILVAVAAIAFMAMTFDTNPETGTVPTATSGMNQTGETGMTDYEVIPTEEGSMPQYDSGSETVGDEMTGEDMPTSEPEVEAEPETPEVTEPMNP